VTLALVALALVGLLPGGLSALRRFEPDYSAAYRWLAPRLRQDDLVATMRPAPAAVYLGRCDFMVAEDRHQEFIMRLDGVWVDRWTGARVLDSPAAFRDEALASGRRVWFVIDEDRFESVSYSPEFVALVLEQMDLARRAGGVLVFQGQGYRPPPAMPVSGTLGAPLPDADFAGQLRLAGYALSTDRPAPGQQVRLELLWQAVQPVRNYSVFVHVVGPGGELLTQVDGEPFLGLYDMTTHWPRDRAVPDVRWLAVPAATPPGRYRLEVGLYDANDLAAGPLPVVDGAGGQLGSSLTLDFFLVDLPLPPEPAHRLDPAQSTLGGLVRLVGYDLPDPATVRAGATLPLTLTWQCLGALADDYTVFVHLLDEGEPLAQADGPPLGGAYPTRFWHVGERLADPHPLLVPADLAPGAYELRVGLYLPAGEGAGQRLGEGLSLGQVVVVAP
jgi:hypothetical protein